jgi:hypothetical protein
MRNVEAIVALIIFVGSAGMTALLMVLLIRYGLKVAPATLRLDALISAAAFGFVFAMAARADESER